MTSENPTHPGVSLRENLRAEGWSVTELAIRLKVSRNTASKLLNQHSSITPEMALALESIGWGDAGFWMHRQADYELALARQRKTEAGGG